LTSNGSSTILEFEDVWFEDAKEAPTKEASVVHREEDSVLLHFNGRDLPLDEETLVISKEYSLGLVEALERNSTMNREMTIFSLKNQVTHASLINANLVRALTNLQWKNALLKQNHELTRAINHTQSSSVRGLEEMLDYLHHSYNTLVRHVNRIENSALHKSSVLESYDRKRSVTPHFSRLQRVITPRNSRAKATFAKPTCDALPSSFIAAMAGSVTDNEEPGLVLKLRCLETNLHMQQVYNQQLKTALVESRAESAKQASLLKELRTSVFDSHRKEVKTWSSYLDDYRLNCEHELERKQQELSSTKL
jgi:hypothetical protein